MKNIKYIMLLIGIFLLSVNSVVYADNELTNTTPKTSSVTRLASSGSKKEYTIKGYSESGSNVNCHDLIADEDKALINEILRYPRIAVPAIIIVLGSIDFFKAVIAGKEDEMKRAQRTFIKRVIIGVAVFFVPALVNVIIWFANVAWSGLGYGAPCPIN